MQMIKRERGRRRKLSSSKRKMVPKQSWGCGWVFDSAQLWQAGGDATLSFVVGVTESKWLPWNLQKISLKCGHFCCEGDAQALGHSSPCWHCVVWRSQRKGNNSERERFCSNTFPLSIYSTCPNLPGLVHCQILAQLSLPGAALDFFGHSWLILTEVTWTAQPGNPKFADHFTWQSRTPCSLPASIQFFFFFSIGDYLI